MKLNKITTIVLCLTPLVACASSMDATITAESAQAVTDAGQAVQADSIKEVITNNVNIPLHYMLLMMAACTFVPNPFELVGKAFTMVFGGIIKMKSLL